MDDNNQEISLKISKSQAVLFRVSIIDKIGALDEDISEKQSELKELLNEKEEQEKLLETLNTHIYGTPKPRIKKSALPIHRQTTGEDEVAVIAKRGNGSHLSEQAKYDATMSLIKKAEYALKSIGRVATGREITDRIFIFEPDLAKKKTFDRLQKDVSANLYLNLSKPSSIINRYRPSEKEDYLYGFKDWFENWLEGGEPKQEYLPKSSKQNAFF